MRVRPWPTPLSLYGEYRARRGPRPQKVADEPALDPQGETGLERTSWKRRLVALANTPDDAQGFVVPAIRSALREVRRGTDLLFTTAPPMSLNIAGLVVAVATGIRWMAEYRDPWIIDGEPCKNPLFRTELGDAVERWLALRCVAGADELIAVSRGIESVLRDPFDVVGERGLAMVRNGIPRFVPHSSVPAGGPIRIVHLGSLYANRDPTPFLRGLASTLDRDLQRPDVVVELVGRGETSRMERLRREARSLGLSDVIRLRDWVPHPEGQKLVESANVLLLLARDQPLQVPNKLYEYLGLRRPILAFIDHAGEAAEMLRRVGGHYLITERTGAAEVPRIISAALRAGTDRSGPASSEALLQDWSTERQMERFVDLVSQCAVPEVQLSFETAGYP